MIPTPAPALDPDVVLTRYTAAIAAVRAPASTTFSYTVAQTGERELEQTHRVYRSGGRERDETVSVEHKKLVPPQVRIFTGRRDRYSVMALAPRPAQYAFTFVGTHRDGHHIDYVFTTARTTPAAYTVTRLTIDGLTFLPQTIAFTTKVGGVRGTGEIVYAKSAAYWMPQRVSAAATLNGRSAHENIVWSNYAFPASLPSSTFSLPKLVPSPAPTTTAPGIAPSAF